MLGLTRSRILYVWKPLFANGWPSASARVRIDKFYDVIRPRFFNFESNPNLKTYELWETNWKIFFFSLFFFVSFVQPVRRPPTSYIETLSKRWMHQFVCLWNAFEEIFRWSRHTCRTISNSARHTFQKMKNVRAHSAAHRSSPPFKLDPNEFDTCAARRIPLRPFVAHRSLKAMHCTISLLWAELKIFVQRFHFENDSNFFLSSFVPLARTRPIEKKKNKTNHRQLKTIWIRYTDFVLAFIATPNAQVANAHLAVKRKNSIYITASNY